jgi:hypothetical protein
MPTAGLEASMTITPAPNLNANLQKDKPGGGGIRDIERELVTQIKNVDDLKQTMNNKYMTGQFRIDISVLSNEDATNGGHTGDYKIDIQTVTRQKSLSVTVGVVFLASDTPNTSLDDLQNALGMSVRNSRCYRVT